LNPAVPDSLKRVITKALAFDPAQRYDDAAKFSNAIIEAFPVRPVETPFSEPSVSDSPALKAEVGEGAPEGATWRSDLLRDIERDLATFIGPVAAIALKRALRQTNDIMSLYDLLARQISNPRDQAEFQARGRRRVTSDPSRRPRSTPPSAPGIEGEPKPDQRTTSPGLANIAAVESNLARYIGPIAKILIKRELEKHETLDKFYRALAAHILDERDRETFLRVQQGN